ncbi:hypothetical protein Fcan01_17784 [Folsomia candida]|uniref:Odorant receptor n=3 Tax=Folsomia candida TaxID=158441 RepID=A0A226DPX7_FOLCA|nr:hypothetical protein Fcan01_17784 [Folsomia candida]
MYSDLFYNLLWANSFVTGHIGVGSTRFNRKRKTYYMTDQTRRKTLRICITSIIFAIHATAKATYMYYFEGGYTNTNFLIGYAFTFIEVLMSGGLILMNVIQDDLIFGMNHFLKYFRKFQGKNNFKFVLMKDLIAHRQNSDISKWIPVWNPNKEKFSYFLDFQLVCQIVILGGAPLTTTLFYIHAPATPIFMHGRLAELGFIYINEQRVNGTWLELGVDWTLYLGDMWLVTLGAQIAFYSLLFSITSGSVYLFSAWMLMFEMRGPDKYGKKNNTYRSIPALRKVENLIREFVCMQIVHNEMMKIVGLVIFGLHAAFSQLCLYCNFVVIENWNILPRTTKMALGSWSLLVQIIWASVLELCGQFCADSKKTLSSWKLLENVTPREKKLMSKFRKTCRPFKFGQEGMFTIKRLTVLKFLRGIVKETFRAVLALG